MLCQHIQNKQLLRGGGCDVLSHNHVPNRSAWREVNFGGQGTNGIMRNILKDKNITDVASNLRQNGNDTKGGW